MIDKLNNAIKHAKKAKMYAKKLVDVENINNFDDFSRLPFTTKQDLRDNYPFGVLACGIEKVIDVHMTSGTTGRPTLSFFTKEDLENSNVHIAKAWSNFGINSYSRVQFMMSYGLFSGAALNTAAIHHIGGFVLPSGVQSTQKQVELMSDFKIDTIVATPSYFLHLHDFLVKNNIPLTSLNLKTGIAAGEAYSDEMKDKISKLLNIRVYDHYGLCEVNTGIIYECNACGQMAVVKDYIYAEIINPETGDSLPDGELGELVLTATQKVASPILRYRTGDNAMILSRSSQCENCFGSFLVSRMKGRIDSVIFYKGLKVDPYELKDLIFIIADNKIYNRIKIIVTENRGKMTKIIEVKISSKPGQDEIVLKRDIESIVLLKVKIPIFVNFVSYDYFEDFNTTKLKIIENIYE